jgi:prolyl-tRNA synthetase
MKSKQGGELVEKRGIEVGNIFQLGYHYSNLMHDAEFTDETGHRQKYYMGCYGIGIGRTLAAVVEKFHDEKGIVWPTSIAPALVYIARIGLDEKVVKAADELYELLTSTGVLVLYDDRDVRPGEKFADADLMGIPYRVVVSPKTVESGKLEVKARQDLSNDKSHLLTSQELLDYIASQTGEPVPANNTLHITSQTIQDDRADTNNLVTKAQEAAKKE